MVYIEDKRILRADTIRMKFIGEHTILVNDNDMLVTVIEINNIVSDINISKHLLVVSKIVEIVTELDKSISVDEIDKFILNNYKEEK